MFSKHEFHYLNVPRIGTFAVNDIFDCTFECLQIPQCVSLNLEVKEDAGGKLLCELLSSDKHKNSTEFKGNEISHHFSIKVSSVISHPHNLIKSRLSVYVQDASRNGVLKLINNSLNTEIVKRK